jgi:hypothetical protein
MSFCPLLSFNKGWPVMASDLDKGGNQTYCNMLHFATFTMFRVEEA